MARSNTLTLQPVAKGVAGSSSSSHVAGTVGGTEGGTEEEADEGARGDEEGGLHGGRESKSSSGAAHSKPRLRCAYAAHLIVPDAAPLDASPPPSDRGAKRASPVPVMQQQLNMLTAREEECYGHGSDESEHMARASSLLDEDFEDPPVEGVDHLEKDAGSPRRLSIGQALSGPSTGI